MHVTSVRLHEFRSYPSLTFTPAQGLCVLVGENAAGKTNVLESLFLCALGRSHRTRRNVELIRQHQPGAAVHIHLTKATGAHTITCKLFADERRELFIDANPLRRSGELLGCLHVVMFSPEDLRLIKNGPSERRRFLDMELSQLSPTYYYALQQYNTALRQRNALLKAPKPVPAAQFLPWEEQLASLGAQIASKRAGFAGRLANTAASLHSALSGHKEALHVAYQPGFCMEHAPSPAEALFAALESGRAKDMLRGSTTTGPHRDDLLLELNGVDVRAFGSQGQQRTAALSLKLSELLLLKELKKEAPVLLLDDVLSELDCARQAFLAQVIEGCQTFITCTQLSGLQNAGLKNMAVYRVENASVIPA